MKSYEKELITLWDTVEENITFTFKDIETIREQMGIIAMKIQVQREELEKSRDVWKEKFQDLKGEKA